MQNLIVHTSIVLLPLYYTGHETPCIDVPYHNSNYALFHAMYNFIAFIRSFYNFLLSNEISAATYL